MAAVRRYEEVPLPCGGLKKRYVGSKHWQWFCHHRVRRSNCRECTPSIKEYEEVPLPCGGFKKRYVGSKHWQSFCHHRVRRSNCRKCRLTETPEQGASGKCKSRAPASGGETASAFTPVVQTFCLEYDEVQGTTGNECKRRRVGAPKFRCEHEARRTNCKKCRGGPAIANESSGASAPASAHSRSCTDEKLTQPNNGDGNSDSDGDGNGDGNVLLPNVQVNCPICLEPVVSGGTFQRSTRSSHCGDRWNAACCSSMYHLDCLSIWLRKSNACPTCRGTALSRDVRAAAREIGLD